MVGALLVKPIDFDLEDARTSDPVWAILVGGSMGGDRYYRLS